MNKQEHRSAVSSDRSKNKVILIGCICGVAAYLEKEAEYLNRAYLLYDAVSGW